MPTNGFSIKPLKVKLLAGEQKATEYWKCCFSFSRVCHTWPKTKPMFTRGTLNHAQVAIRFFMPKRKEWRLQNFLVGFLLVFLKCNEPGARQLPKVEDPQKGWAPRLPANIGQNGHPPNSGAYRGMCHNAWFLVALDSRMSQTFINSGIKMVHKQTCNAFKGWSLLYVLGTMPVLIAAQIMIPCSQLMGVAPPLVYLQSSPKWPQKNHTVEGRNPAPP